MTEPGFSARMFESPYSFVNLGARGLHSLHSALVLHNSADEPDDQTDDNYGSHQTVSQHCSLLNLRDRIRNSDEPLCTIVRAGICHIWHTILMSGRWVGPSHIGGAWSFEGPSIFRTNMIE